MSPETENDAGEIFVASARRIEQRPDLRAFRFAARTRLLFLGVLNVDLRAEGEVGIALHQLVTNAPR